MPIALKIAPDLSPEQVQAIAERLVAHRVDGVVATNTTVSREGVEGLPHSQESGGLSGAPLTARASRIVRLLARHLRGRIPVIGAGGIMSGADAADKLAAGASLVQLYTGLAYAGPALIYDCVKRISAARPAATEQERVT